MTLATAAGEEAIIGTYFAPLAAGYPGAFGLKDDCALIAPPAGFDLVVKTDPIREGVHFRSSDPPDTIGWKALAVNVSDLIAKGASPHAYTLALSFPSVPSRDWLAAFVKGLADAQVAFGCHLIGGDTDRAPGPLSIAVTIMGLVPHSSMVRRVTARPGDLLYVSGTLGDSAIGLRIVRGDLEPALTSIASSDRSYLVDRYRRPQPRLPLAPLLREYAAAAMDLSDGLAKDLGRMTRASHVGAEVDLAKLPLSRPACAMIAARPDLHHLTWSGGDDYEVLCAVPPSSAEAFEAEARRAGIPVTAIGSVKTGGDISFPGFDAAVAAHETGWDHF